VGIVGINVIVMRFVVIVPVYATLALRIVIMIGVMAVK
jgi:hypothetical protein